MKVNSVSRLVMTALVTIAFVGCTTTNPTTGQKEFDPVKTDNVIATLRPLVSEGITRIIKNSPQHSDEIATYFRAVGGVFCKMAATGNFNPSYLLDEADKATAGLQQGLDPYVISIKNGLLTLYGINYAARFNAELPPDKWPLNVAKLFCGAINSALLDAGKAGINSAAVSQDTRLAQADVDALIKASSQKFVLLKSMADLQ